MVPLVVLVAPINLVTVAVATDLHLLPLPGFVRAISLLPVTHHHLSEQIPCPSVRGFFPNPAQGANLGLGLERAKCQVT